MKDCTIIEIRKYCDRYGDKFIELMDKCGATCLPDVPEETAVQFLEELKVKAL